MNASHQRPRIFTWHIHGSYLYYLSQGDFDIFIPVNRARSQGYYGRGQTFPFGSNVHEIDAAKVKDHSFDVILFQTERNYAIDQYEVLSPAQRQLPCIYLEHNTPSGTPANTRHIVDDPDVQLVHVTYYNRLMWDNNRTPAVVIEHGVTEPDAPYTGELARGLVIINHLPDRGRTLGWDIFRELRAHLPLDLIGMGNGRDGLGEVLHPNLPAFRGRYRFIFHPVRHTSLGLAVCESMMQGIPIVGLATTELVTVIQNGRNGYIHTDIDYLAEKMRLLLQDPAHAAAIGDAGRQTARERFGIRQFNYRWEQLLQQLLQRKTNPQTITAI
ncbi:glycosyltransferase [Chitinophaga lutea]